MEDADGLSVTSHQFLICYPDLTLRAAAFLAPKDLIQLVTSLSSSLRESLEIQADALWCKYSREECLKRSDRYHTACSATSPSACSPAGASWADVYRLLIMDSKRTFICTDEMAQLNWWFNFSSGAGGGTHRSAQKVVFNSEAFSTFESRMAELRSDPSSDGTGDPDYHGRLSMRGYPPMPWKLEPLDPPAPKASALRTCERCGKPASKRCGNCKAQWYCSVKCQRAAWKRHKTVCAVSSHILETASSALSKQVLHIVNFPPHEVSR
jgi:hypothetical protein